VGLREIMFPIAKCAMDKGTCLLDWLEARQRQKQIPFGDDNQRGKDKSSGKDKSNGSGNCKKCGGLSTALLPMKL
jgi:hypothetical protein